MRVRFRVLVRYKISNFIRLSTDIQGRGYPGKTLRGKCPPPLQQPCAIRATTLEMRSINNCHIGISAIDYNSTLPQRIDCLSYFWQLHNCQTRQLTIRCLSVRWTRTTDLQAVLRGFQRSQTRPKSFARVRRCFKTIRTGTIKLINELHIRLFMYENFDLTV